MRLPEATDVLVVGGGPAGLAAAQAAAAGGARTVVVEQEAEIGEPVHTSGGMTTTAMRAFDIPRELYHPLEKIRIVSPNEQASFHYPDPVVCVIDVRRVYRLLAARAAESGATVVTGATAREPLRVDGRLTGWTVETAAGSHRVESSIVVDASGYRASVAKAAALHPGFTRFGVGAEYELRAPKVDQSEGLLLVGNTYAPAGYAWIFPWGEDRVRVGVGVHHADVRSDPKDHLQLLVEHAGRFGVDLGGATREESHFGLIPTNGLPARLTGDGIMAVGDAACQATLVVGEGIRLSIVAGRKAGEVAARAVAAGRSDRDTLEEYEHWFRRRYGTDLRIGAALNRRLAVADDEKWDANVRLLRKLPPGLLARLLLSEFPLLGLLRWVAFRPDLWGFFVRYGLKARVAG